jgi:hypothetical protein
MNVQGNELFFFSTSRFQNSHNNILSNLNWLAKLSKGNPKIQSQLILKFQPISAIHDKNS